MGSVLSSRLTKLERTFPAPEQQRRVICVVAAEGDDVGVQRLRDAERYEPDNGDLPVIHSIVSPAGQEPWSQQPYVLHWKEGPAHSPQGGQAIVVPVSHEGRGGGG